MSQNLGKTLSMDGNSSFLRALAKVASSKNLVKIQQALGTEAQLHLVGGVVRDSFLGIENVDIDLASKLAPDEAALKLKKSKIKVVETGLQHGTLTIVLGDSNIELTTFRQPAPHGVNNYSESIETDLSGRDFTINAIAYSINNQTIIDPYNGLSDLSNKFLKAVNDPKQRFAEDPLRILRMIRFGPASNFELDKKTEKAAISLADKLKEISPERIRDELFKILVLEHASTGLRFLRDHNLLEYTLPEMLPAVNCEQNKYHIHDVFEHTLWVIDRAPPEIVLRLAALFHDLGKPDTLSIGADGERHFYKHELNSGNIAKNTLARLHCSKKLIKEVKTIVRLHMRPLDCGPAGIRRIIKDTGEYYANWRKLKLADAPPTVPADEYQKLVDEFDQKVAKELTRSIGSPFQNLMINGDDLIELGMQPGPKIGKILKNLHEKVLEDPKLNTKTKLIELSKKALGQTRQS
ncbi:MAG: CCA tRNA nucleotidyltransferase [Bdellovibrionota bacterium]